MNSDLSSSRSPARRAVLMAMDGLFLAAGLAAIFMLWLGFSFGYVPAGYRSLYFHIVLPLVAVRVGLLAWFGLYRAASRHAGSYELRTITIAMTAGSALLILLRVVSRFIPSLGSFPLNAAGTNLLLVPTGIILNDWMFSLLAIGGARFARREFDAGMLRGDIQSARRVVIVGAGDAGGQVARDLTRTTLGAYRPVAFVDSNRALVGSKIHGVPVAGTLEDLPQVIRKFEPQEIVIALQKPAPRVLRQIVADCRSARLEFRIVPTLTSVIAGEVTVNTLRPVEIEDLLGRDPVMLDAANAAYLSGRRLLVTGAGGSIGRELCRQAIEARPASIALLGRGENSLFEAELELRPLAKKFGVALKTVVADVRDESAIDRSFDEIRPEVVFHAAAHKHVHFMEAQPEEAVKTNVMGTLVAARAAARIGAERFIFISTDKAVRPTGAMGASKRIAEMVVSAIGAGAKGSFSSVRFGNVLGSRGSVIPTFRRQIEMGGPVTVTDPEASRFFMTTAEAVSLVIQAGAMGRGGELFVLDMGQPMKVADLARNLIALSGLEPETDIAIEFTGLRPGEKLTEELLTQEEGIRATEHGKIFITRSDEYRWDELGMKVEELILAAEGGDRKKLGTLFSQLISEYKKG